MILTGKQLRDALAFIAPDVGDEDQLETEAIFHKVETAFTCPETGELRPAGIYVGLAEYPEEGSVQLDP